jgi:spore germination cell wall hydrolase CwlJ-like protein
MKVETLNEWRALRRRRKLVIAIVAVSLLAIIAGAVIAFTLLRPHVPIARSKSTRLPPAASSAPSPLNLPPPDLLKPIAPEEALKENAARPFSGRSDTAAAAFNLKTDDKSRGRALECLTQAVYYEAASEGLDGERAVAQVVLNRMRHPAYPSTVCGVVYQGAERASGCQFTFTCDGSLARVPVQSLWKQAQKVATEALAGKVYAPVGHATHYHADYVLPFWADSLDKSAQVGRHIFYRLKGGLGSAGAFSQRYGGREPEPPAPSTVEVSLQALENLDPMLGAPTVDSGLQASGGELVAPTPPVSNLVADTTKGKLLLDGDEPQLPQASTAVTAPKESNPCDAAAEYKRIRAMSANDLHSKGANGC